MTTPTGNTNGNAADEVVGSVPITLDRARNLKFDWQAIEKLERLLGRGFLSGDERAATWNGFTEMKAFLWAGLSHEDPKLTIDQLDGMISLKKCNEYSEALTKAMIMAMPEGAPMGEKKDSPPTPAVQ